MKRWTCKQNKQQQESQPTHSNYQPCYKNKGELPYAKSTIQQQGKSDARTRWRADWWSSLQAKNTWNIMTNPISQAQKTHIRTQLQESQQHPNPDQNQALPTKWIPPPVWGSRIRHMQEMQNRRAVRGHPFCIYFSSFSTLCHTMLFGTTCL